MFSVVHRVVEIRPYSTGELVDFYENIKYTTMLRWIEVHCKDIGQRKGRYYNTAQVDRLFKKLGVNYKIIIGNTTLEVKPSSTLELSILYKVSNDLMIQMIKDMCPNVGVKAGGKYAVFQVTYILSNLGIPHSVIIDENNIDLKE